MIQENLEIYFKEFAVQGELLDGTFISGIFDQEFLQMDIGVEGRQITFCAKSTDVTDLHHGDTITINSIPYSIVGIEPQGDGAITDLVLKM